MLNTMLAKAQSGFGPAAWFVAASLLTTMVMAGVFSTVMMSLAVGALHGHGLYLAALLTVPAAGSVFMLAKA